MKWIKSLILTHCQEHMSEYSRVNAPIVFNDLIQNLKVRYIVTTYNNTYDSKNSSSRNKITLEQIQEILGSIVC